MLDSVEVRDGGTEPIFERDAVIVCLGHAMRGQIDFAHAVWEIDDEVRDAESGEAAAEMGHDVEAGLDGGSEVVRALSDVAEEEVVGAASIFKEPPREGFVCQGRGIDAIEEDALVSEDATGFTKLFEGVFGFDADFVWVIELGIEVDGREAIEEVQEGGVMDALRQGAGHARADANDVDVRAGSEAFDHAGQSGGGEREGIAAGEEDVTDVWVLADGVDGAHDLLKVGRVQFADL